MELPQAGVTGLGGPAGGRDINATTAGPLPKGGGLCSHPPLWLPRTSSTSRRWCMHGKSWERPTPRSARRPVWFQHGGHRHEEPIRATFGDSPNSGAVSSQGTCRPWLKRSCSPCLPRARRRRRPEDAYPLSRQWLPWGGSPPCNGTGCGEFLRRQWIPRDSDSSEGPTYSSSWPNRAPGWGSGKSMPRRSYPSPRSAELEKYRRFADRTSPKWESRTRGSSATIARSRDDLGHTRRHGLRGSAGSRPVRRQHWEEQRISKWVWPSSCRGPTQEKPGGMPGDERAQPTSGGWDFRGDTSCGGVDGTTSKLPSCTRLPLTNLNVCRLRDCLGQPLKEFAGEEPTSGTSGRPASWSSSKMTRKSAHPQRRPSEHNPHVETAGPKRRAPQRYGRSAQDARREEATNPDARSRKESQGQEPQQTSSLPKARGPWTRCRRGIGLRAEHQKPRLLPRRVPSTSMRSRTWRWVPRDSMTPVEEHKEPDSLEVVDGSRDGQGVSRHG